jgi:hypothetical protein
MLSLALERGVVSALLEPSPGNLAFRAHLSLLQVPHAGDWLQAVPSEVFGNAIAPSLFRISLQCRLRQPVYDTLSFCPLCDAVLDTFGDHSKTCSCGGDRTSRHNHVRNVGARFLHAAGLRPELEKAGLLPQRPRTDCQGLSASVPPRQSSRRPADVFVPRWHLGRPAAFDFAVSSGMKGGSLEESVRDGNHAASSYAEMKRAHLGTAAVCESQGILFIPMVCETHGGSWDKEALEVWRQVAKARSLISGEPWERGFQQMMQTLSVAIHRANAQAIATRALGRGKMFEGGVE